MLAEHSAGIDAAEMGRTYAVVAVALVLSACAGPVAVVEPGRAPEPYTGPLYLEPAEARTAVEREAGVAARVVQCRGSAEGGRNEGRSYGGEVGRTPAEGLTIALEEASASGPEHGWRLDREKGDRALITVTVAGRRKAAAVMRRGPALGDQFGWYAESYAYCNVAEFPPTVAAELGVQIWTDEAGLPVDTRRIVSSRGPEHCNWTSMTFLNLDGGSGGETRGSTYVRAPEADLLNDYFAEPHRLSVGLPDDAVDTGYQHDGQRLWLSADRRRAYVGADARGPVELWPRTTQPLLCA